MFSSIEEDDRRTVINNCYWPLFKLVEMGFPIAIEAPALTLEIIQAIDKNWIDKLKQFIRARKIEFIGSGYSQIIGPLVPAEVNDWNQSIGQDIYQEILGVEPQMALVNEMDYSSGMIEHYANHRYKSIIMEWNNPRKEHPDWKNVWRYYPQTVKGSSQSELALIWADSIAFQKFQRYAHGYLDLSDYIDYIQSNNGSDKRFFPLYSNDAEIFDYRPGRYGTEHVLDSQTEWDRIQSLFALLNEQTWCNLIFPSEVLNSKRESNTLALESPAQPIPVKKQEKYNINRWALSGRDDLAINTKCYQLYHSLSPSKQTQYEDWRELCYLWSSDFRTHITEKRWIEYKKQLDEVVSNRSPEVGFEKYSQHDKSKIECEVDSKWVTVNNGNYRLVLNKHKGLAIHKLVIKKYGNRPIFGTIEHGFYDDITMGADYYSGNVVIDRPAEHKITDLEPAHVKIDKNQSSITISSELKGEGYNFQNHFSAFPDGLLFNKTIEIKTTEKSVIRPFCLTLLPDSWDRDSLYIESHNGGVEIEKYFLKGQNLSHGNIYSSLISARHGLGNTEGKLVVGDKTKTMSILCDMSRSALIASIDYFEMNDNYFFRILYSARELDETRRGGTTSSSISLSIFLDLT